MTGTPSKLDEICVVKREDVAKRKAMFSIAELEQRALQFCPPRSFCKALRAKSQSGFGLVAEIKRASPSKGLIRADFTPAAHAKSYQSGGAACLSVLTDEPYFQGKDSYLVQARAACTLPCLRKDFIVDPWQVLESRSIGADAILVIMAAVDDVMAAELSDAANVYDMNVLVEVHDEAEMERALELGAKMIGINNRDLRSFTTDLAVTERLAAMVPNDVLLLSESGIATHADCQRLARQGVHCFLVGESLMRQDDIQSATRMLLTGQK